MSNSKKWAVWGGLATITGVIIAFLTIPPLAVQNVDAMLFTQGEGIELIHRVSNVERSVISIQATAEQIADDKKKEDDRDREFREHVIKSLARIEAKIEQ